MRRRRWTTAAVLAAALPAGVLLAGCAGGEQAASDGATPDTAAAAGEQGAAETGSRGTASDSAALLARRVMSAQGGADAWEATRFLRFDWIVEQGGETAVRRSHAWDRYEGDYRLEHLRQDSSRVVALFDLPTLASDSLDAEGDVWVDGDRLSGAARDSALDAAYRAFVNDSYWLLMPLKWRDPGVHLEYTGLTELPDGRRYPTVHLTFDEGLGVTNDEYWGFVDPETGRMAAWRFHLEGDEQKGPVIWWRDWRSFGPQGLELAMNREFAAGPVRIHFEDVAADTAVPSGAFQPPGE